MGAGWEILPFAASREKDLAPILQIKEAPDTIGSIDFVAAVLFDQSLHPTHVQVGRNEA